MVHVPKIFQAIDTFELTPGAPPGSRPSVSAMVSCVGIETVKWASPVKLEGKVELYMHDVVKGIKASLVHQLDGAVNGYCKEAREVWLFKFAAQPTLMVTQMMWVNEVEESFHKVCTR